MNQITFQSVKDTSTSPIVNVGQRAQTPDGREWVYVKAAEAISAYQAVVPDAVVAVDTVHLQQMRLEELFILPKHQQDGP